MAITNADVSRDLTQLFIGRCSQMEGSVTVTFDPRAKHDWEVHGSCVKVTVIIRTSPFDPRFRSHFNRAYSAACLLRQEQTEAHIIREH
jgi:hypothetical protein